MTEQQPDTRGATSFLPSLDAELPDEVPERRLPPTRRRAAPRPPSRGRTMPLARPASTWRWAPLSLAQDPTP